MTISSTPSKYFVATSAYLLPILILLCSGLFLYILFFSPVFQIKKITCIQDVGEPCQNNFILAELDRFAGQNLFLADTQTVKRRLLAGDPTLRSLTYYKSLPGNLTLELHSVYPALALTMASQPSYFTFDSALRLIKVSVHAPNVPLVRLDQPLTLRLGEQLQDEPTRQLLLTCLELARRLPGTVNFTLQGSNIVALLEDGTTRALFNLERELESQISALHATRTGVTISLSSPVIDVRFSQPIIKDSSSL